MVKSVILTPSYILLEVIAVRKAFLKKIEDYGFKIIKSSSVDGLSYMLTPRQEEVLIKAFLKGYYSFPRRACLAEIAESLGISISTLSELIRKAESKVVEAFMIHELPHYLCNPSSLIEHDGLEKSFSREKN